MKAVVTLLSLVLFLAGVGDVAAQTRSFKDHSFNGAKPERKGDTVIFRLGPADCSKRTYGDGRGESDCANGNLRSRIKAPKDARVGKEYEYSFEIYIPQSFTYPGDRTHPTGTRLEVAEWGRTKGIKNHVYEMKLDARRGLMFERETCVSPKDFGRWNRVTVTIKWSKGQDGYLVARCNGRVVLERRNTQTVIPPDCGQSWKMQCDPARQKPDASIYWQVGPKFGGYGVTYKSIGKPSQFAAFPKGGIELAVRDLYMGRPR